ncbi:MAG: ATP-binding protein [Candidatus Berkelbacteria bacterium]
MYINLVFWASLIIILLLGFFVYAASPKENNNKFFLFVSLGFSVWMIFNFSVDYTSNPTLALYLSRLDYASAAIFSYLFVLFALYFPKGDVSVKKKLVLAIFPCLFFVVSIFTGLIIQGVNPIGNGFELINGSLEPLYEAFLLIYLLIIGVGTSLSKLKKMSGLEKSQLIFVLVGFFILIVVAVIANLVLPLIYPEIATISRLGYSGIIIWASITAYAIIKKNLFDIKVILTETATVIVSLALLVQLIVADNSVQKIISSVILGLVVYGGYLLIKSVQDEIKKKDQLQLLSTQLAEANVHLKDLDKMKTEFVSLASHELLTPVSAIEGYLSMMLDEKLVKLEDPKAVQYMDRVYRSAKRLARLISDMLNISRIEEGRLLVEKKEINMVEVIQQVIEELKFKADEHKQKVVFDQGTGSRVQGIEKTDDSNLTPATSLTPKTSNLNPSFLTFADPDKVKEILVNIIGNSIKYTLQPGTITVTIEKAPTSVLNSEWGKLEQAILASPVDDQESIHAVGDEHMKQIVGDQQYLIRVKDQGVGIPKEELTKLFKKFHRVGNYSTQESQGTGLGLYITRALVELHHGRIWPDSEGMGKGSTFTFSLPTIEAKQAIIDLEAQSPQDKEQLKPLAKPMGNDDEL